VTDFPEINAQLDRLDELDRRARKLLASIRRDAPIAAIELASIVRELVDVTNSEVRRLVTVSNLSTDALERIANQIDYLLDRVDGDRPSDRQPVEGGP